MVGDRQRVTRRGSNAKVAREIASAVHKEEVRRRFPLTLSDVEGLLKSRKPWRDLTRTRFLELIGTAMDLGWLEIRYEGGYAYLATQYFSGLDVEFIDERAADLIPLHPRREKDYYPAIRSWLGLRYRCLALDVSELGKRGYRRGEKALVAVPDIAGLRYLPGYHDDTLALVAVEVKSERPKSQHLSEAYRYTRFADYSLLAYDSE